MDSKLKIGYYAAFVFGILGILFPHYFSGDIDAKVIRKIAWALFILMGVIIADTHLFGSAIFKYLSNL